MFTSVRHYSGRGASVSTPDRDTYGTFGMGQLRRLVFSPARMMAEHHRWLLLLVPLYALAVGGQSAWVLAVGLSASFIAYNVAVSIAKQRRPLWVAKSEVSLRCVEIALIYMAHLSLREESLNSHYFLTSMYMLFVILAALGTGRRGAFWTASCAALAATIYHTVTFYEDPIIISLAGINYSAGADYWIVIALYAATLWCVYLGVGLRVVRDCGGEISVQPKADCGSAFTISRQKSS